MLAAVVACQPGTDVTEGETAGLKVFRYSLDSAPTSLDPVRASTLYANQIVVNLYDTLYVYKYLQRPYELRPSLGHQPFVDERLAKWITQPILVNAINDEPDFRLKHLNALSLRAKITASLSGPSR